MNVIHESGNAGVRKRRERNAEAILDAAMAIVAREGLEGLTLQRVAKECEYVPAALYRYFPSKDALVAALQRRTVSDIHTRFLEESARWESCVSGASENVTALVPIVGAARFYIGLPREMPEAFRLVMLLLGDPRPLVSDDEAARAQPLLEAFLTDVTALFVRAQRAGAVTAGDARARTLVYWATLQGLIQLAKLGRMYPVPPDISALCDLAVRTLMIGWGSPPVSLHAAMERLEVQ